MKKLVAITVILTAFLSALGQDVWIQKDSVKGPPRANVSSFVLEDDGYFVTGYDGSNKKRSMVSYDIDQDDWDDELSIGGSTGDGLNRSSAVGFTCGLYGYAGLGEGEGFMFKDLWKFDRYNNVWTQMADFGGEARTQAVVFTIGEAAYVGTGKGSDLSTFYDDFWKYDPNNNNWTSIADFPGTPRLDAVASDMTGKGYVGLGYDGSAYKTDFYEYFPVTNSWSQLADFPGAPRINATCFGVFPQFFITTGDDGFNFLNDTWEYNYFGDSWTQRADFPGEPRSGASSFVIENRPFVGLGYGNGNYYDDFYEYTILLSERTVNSEAMQLYPNPADDYVMLSALENGQTIKIHNHKGKELYSNKIFATEKKIDLTSFSKGIYFVSIFEDDELLQTKKFILAH